MAILSKKEVLNKRVNPKYFDQGVWNVVNCIKQDVIERGDSALRDLTAKFDAVEIKDFLVSKDKIEETTVPEFLEIVAKRIRKVNEKILAERKPVKIEGEGYDFMLKSSPIESVGLYVPGGLAAYPSSVLMLGIPAKVAGVKRIVLCTPPPVSEITLAAAKAVGVSEIYQVGGSQAIFAMAYGTESIKPVDKIFGPGNKYVNTAKMMLGDRCGIDIFAGPSEILILADETADPRLIKADLESQAEHGADGDCILVTTSRELAESIEGGAVLVDSIDEGIEFANRYRAEHTEVITVNSREDALKIRGGAVFIGSDTCVPMGDYGVSGSNHVIPTGGATRFQSPVSVEDFLIRTEYTEVKEPKKAADFVPEFATLEGLPKHAESVKLRISNQFKS
ncbi:MAG: histidinol dehydrogenase [Patescibacteria group bacterium]|nr:histidinol dehydrogenase [Patescibacteria group bacterium]